MEAGGPEPAMPSAATPPLGRPCPAVEGNIGRRVKRTWFITLVPQAAAFVGLIFLGLNFLNWKMGEAMLAKKAGNAAGMTWESTSFLCERQSFPRAIKGDEDAGGDGRLIARVQASCAGASSAHTSRWLPGQAPVEKT